MPTVHISSFGPVHPRLKIPVNPVSLISEKLIQLQELTSGVSQGVEFHDPSPPGPAALKQFSKLLEKGIKISVIHKHETSAEGCRKVAVDLSSILAEEGREDDFVIHMGIYPVKSEMILERTAYNWADFRTFGPDLRDFEPAGEKISEDVDAPLQIVQSRDFEQMAEEMRKRIPSTPCAVSDDPERHCCNYIFFLSAYFEVQKQMKAEKENRSHPGRFEVPKQGRAMFLHVPFFSEISLEKQVEWILTFLEVLYK